MKRVCVECGRKSADQQLYREFSGGTIQLSQCVSHSYYSTNTQNYSSIFHYTQTHCKEVIDKYVEFDAVILLLDVLMLRVQSYRHLIFNHTISNSVSQSNSTHLVVSLYILHHYITFLH